MASVAVLALALSSIGGVTYSWFSDMQSADIGVITAGLDVDVVVTIEAQEDHISKSSMIEITEEETGAGIVRTLVIADNQVIKDTTKGSFKVNLEVTNRSGIAVTINPKIVHTKELAGFPYTDEQNQTKYSYETVKFATDENGNKDYTHAKLVDWYSSYSNLLFGGSSGVKASYGTPYNYPVSGTATDSLGANPTRYERIQYQDYYYSSGKTIVQPYVTEDDVKTISIDMYLGDLFDWGVIDDLRVVVDIGQYSLYSSPISDVDGKGSVVITQEMKSAKTPIMFIAKDLMVTVSGTTIADLSKVDIEYTHSGDIRTVVLRYYTLNPSYDPEAEDPGEEYIEKTEGINGDVTLSFGSGDLFGSLTSPASKGMYTFINGGTS